MSLKKGKPEKEKTQSKKFIEKAKEIGTDDSPETFERVFKKIVSTKTQNKNQDNKK